MTPSNEVAIKTLAKYLREEIGVNVIEDWPDPKIEMDLPCISIIGLSRDYTNTMPTLAKTIPSDDEPGKVDAIYTIGQYDYNLQLDIWCEYKAQRSVLFEKIQDAFNKAFLNDQGPCGLFLTLEDYYDTIASYNQTGYTYLDNEESAQRSEWRLKLDVQVTHSKISVRTMAKIEEITIKAQISDNNNVEEDNLDIEETFTE